jgi:hypothetical protein
LPEETIPGAESSAAPAVGLREDYETALAGELAAEANQARPTPETRLVAAQLIAGNPGPRLAPAWI